MLPRILLTLLPLSGCADMEKTVDDRVDDPAPGFGYCGTTVEWTSPSDGAVDAYYRDPIVFALTDPRTDATITAPVPGATTWGLDGRRLTFTPDTPLTPSTEYSFRLGYCGGSIDLRFRTSDIGSEPVSTDLDGRAWIISLAGGVSYGIGAIITSYLTADLLLGAGTVGAGSIELTLDTADAWCGASSLTSPFPDDPFVEVNFGRIQLELAGYAAPLYDATLSGTFTGDGTIVVGTLVGLLDTRDLGELVTDSADHHSFCELAEELGEVCQACPDGAGLCLPLRVDELVGMESSPPSCP